MSTSGQTEIQTQDETQSKTVPTYDLTPSTPDTPDTNAPQLVSTDGGMTTPQGPEGGGEAAVQPAENKPWSDLMLAFEGFEFNAPASWVGKDPEEQQKNAQILYDLLRTECDFATMTTRKARLGTEEPEETYVWRWSIYANEDKVTTAINNINKAFKDTLWDWNSFPGSAYAIITFNDGTEKLVQTAVTHDTSLDEILENVLEKTFAKINALPEASADIFDTPFIQPAGGEGDGEVWSGSPSGLADPEQALPDRDMADTGQPDLEDSEDGEWNDRVVEDGEELKEEIGVGRSSGPLMCPEGCRLQPYEDLEEHMKEAHGKEEGVTDNVKCVRHDKKLGDHDETELDEDAESYKFEEQHGCDCNHEEWELQFTQQDISDICTFLECGCENDRSNSEEDVVWCGRHNKNMNDHTEWELKDDEKPEDMFGEEIGRGPNDDGDRWERDCDACGGTGVDENGLDKCVYCDGKGKRYDRPEKDPDRFHDNYEEVERSSAIRSSACYHGDCDNCTMPTCGHECHDEPLPEPPTPEPEPEAPVETIPEVNPSPTVEKGRELSRQSFMPHLDDIHKGLEELNIRIYKAGYLRPEDERIVWKYARDLSEIAKAPEASYAEVQMAKELFGICESLLEVEGAEPGEDYTHMKKLKTKTSKPTQTAPRGEPVTCPTCGGLGAVPTGQFNERGGEIKEVCQTCHGDGRVIPK